MALMTKLMKSDVLIRLRHAHAIGSYAPMAPRQICRMPADHARLLVEQGIAEPWDEARVPVDATVFPFTAADFVEPPPPPEKPEPITESELLKTFDWTGEMLARARTFGFPQPTGRRLPPDALGPGWVSNSGSVELLYSRAAIDGWIATIRQIAATLPKNA